MATQSQVSHPLGDKGRITKGRLIPIYAAGGAPAPGIG